MPRSMRPSTMLSVAALVSAHARDGAHGVGPPWRAGNPGQHLQQRQQRPRLAGSRRPLQSTVPSEGTHNRAVLI